ncbi:LPS O-antigen length regulator [Psychrosphaera ytuae]|uniref:LPS O-antigen length regulator n=1 Tax=Psychrosphaera ytuae TaxID=2820710 RepID=A0A975DE07_9GAMM|nr:Wzz/FepE/Etk N-terminal domain-containing protein [Psychrosphaera ytuae]QTH64631.1 LPS O-antigen length regulator [Psychrosphaera ytuae]
MNDMNESEIQRLEKKISELQFNLEGKWASTRPVQQSQVELVNENEIDIAKLASVIWQGRVKIIMLTVFITIVSVLYALSLPNIYTSTIKLVPSSQDSEGGLSSLASKYGGLASMAGIDLGGSGESNSVAHAVELMKSWPYLEEFVESNDLKVTLMATNGWSRDSNRLLYDESVYDLTTKTWKMKSTWFSDKLKSAEPTSYETYQKIKKDILDVNFDEELGIFSISINHFSPQVAYELTERLKDSINNYFKLQDRREALASIEFLERKIESTNNAQMREVFYSMIESHTQKVMMTEVNKEYLLKTLIPAKKPEPDNKTKPKRAIIVGFGVFMGLFWGTILVFLINFRSKKEV